MWRLPAPGDEKRPHAYMQGDVDDACHASPVFRRARLSAENWHPASGCGREVGCRSVIGLGPSALRVLAVLGRFDAS